MQAEIRSASKEALDLGGSKNKGRARKEGSVSTVRNAETQVDKRADKITPKQSPFAATSSKIKKVQRSDLGIKKSPPQIKRARSATTATSVRNEINLVKLRKLKSDSSSVVAHGSKWDDETVAAGSSEDLGINNLRLEEDDRVKAITENADQILDLEPEEEEEAIEEEQEVEKEIEGEKKSLEIKDITINLQEQKPKKLAIEEKKLLHGNDRSPPLTPIVKEVAPAVNRATIQAKHNPTSDKHHGASSKLQSLTDLIMWRDVSRSAFFFGVGAFAIISSSYTKDLNISCISVLSYLGLVYLALSFIFRSLMTRGNIDMDSRDKEYVVGEEEAVWLIKLVLPYLNEFLSKLRSLFSGDPATTMKLAVLLFILARCGGSITIWKMTKLGFFGVFMVPKLSSSYSSHLAGYGTFWIERFGDAWESCRHKKAVAFGIFTLVWNLSSLIARIWTIFLLFVAFRYYQQCRIKHQEQGFQGLARNSQFPYMSGNRKSNIIDIKKQNKVC